MEPQLPVPNPSPESGSFRANEILPRVPNVEQAPEQPPAGGERQETRERKVTGDGSNDPAQSVTAVPVMPPITVPVAPVPTPPSVTDDDTPVAAGDVDLIEKEWVDKAKKVIAQTKHDPYLQEQAVSRLQADYLHKRYGKEVKLPSEG